MNCRHHWILDEPSGAPQVQGRCKRCRKKRMFDVTGPDMSVTQSWKELG